MSSLIMHPAILASPRGMADGTIKYSIECPELPPDKMGRIFSMMNKHVYIMLKEETFLNEEKKALESLKTMETVGKSPSERLRGVLFVNWKNNSEGFATFDQFYFFKMEQLIKKFKSLIDV